ncbi:hypothetical protein EK21DRAFT_66407 [Setomelanomma holmii]|uniref:Uncharacterized protein n=1 Tax=Setomelanomma holmii TaxID=210430 RepID=A0A9P4H8D5_9PLEO|nr:hypothetical protein EK21DRAFT_66407 [Setomelanomma holmii]
MAASSKVGRKNAVVGDSNARISRRPARGFHRFRSGVLNVTPKGAEKAQTLNNQNSPLLRLPPELRNKIWRYVLGGNVLRWTLVSSSRYSLKYRMAPPPGQIILGLDLLRTCRQIYAETALLPYQLNTFACTEYAGIKGELQYLQPFQRSHIAKLQLEASSIRGLWLGQGYLSDIERYTDARFCGKYKLGFLPALEEIQVCVLTPDLRSESAVDECKRSVRDQLSTLLAGKQVDITFENL